VFLAAFAVYIKTLAVTVPFWDSGEFIAVAYILGIPHPPGTPFYVLLARLATLFPWFSVAQRVNGLSAVVSSVAVMFAYLCGLKIIRLAQAGGRRAGPDEPPPADDWIAHLGAVIGALMLAYSDAFWENSIEAEVYSMASMAQSMCLWLGLRWWEEHERRPTAGPLLLCVYVMWLCVGLHLSVAIMGGPLLVLVALVDWRVALVFLMPFISSMFVTKGLEFIAGIMLVFGVITFAVYAWQRKLNGWVVAGSTVAAIVGMVPAFTDADFTATTALIAAAGIIVPVLFLARRAREGRILALAIVLMVIGYSTHLYLPIRANLHPAVNEGAPSDWSAMRDLLERKQYGQTSMFQRRAPISVQLNKEFWRYFRRQWPLAHTPRLWGTMLPLLLGLVGGGWLARRDRTSFLYTGTFLGLCTAGLIVYLNFTDHEVRERDYFFQPGFHAYSMWIGMGVAFAITWVRDSFASARSRTLAAAGTAALLSLQPILVCRNLWFTHDESNNWIAHDYAYNMLKPLDPNSYVYTNGDNDTFPLWYMQEVEHLRKDVRVVNLSLLNTDWYIKQLRDEQPKVPISLTDHEISVNFGTGMLRYVGSKQTALDSLVREFTAGGGGITQDGYVVGADGRPVYTNAALVRHITEQSKKGTSAWAMQPYFAVTVPEHMGLEPYFTLEGLVYRVNRDSLEGAIDVEKTRRALYDTFKYRGLFTADGSWDSTVYKDENASTLTRNYAAAHLQLAITFRREHKLDQAIAEMERVGRMFPDYVEVQIPLGGFYLDHGDTAKALALFEKIARIAPGNPEARYYYGVSLVSRGNLEAGLKELDAAIQLDPDYNLAYYAAYSLLWDRGQHDRSLDYLERWLRLHPNDTGARALLEQGRGGSGAKSSSRPPPPPRVPGMP
jgi:hypothetical protein